MASTPSPEPSTRPILAGTAAVYVAALTAAFQFHGLAPSLTFSAQGVLNVGSTVAPLFAISAFVERAVEIVITATRGPGALALSRALEVATDDAAKEVARCRLDVYRLQTQRYSFAVALGIALFAAVVGVRAVAPLLTSPPPQNRWFDLFDVTLTSLLLAGGSEGIHQVVTTITTFLHSSKSSSKQRAAGPGADGGG